MTTPSPSLPPEDSFGSILISAHQDADGAGYFSATLQMETDARHQPLPTAVTSTSKKGLFPAVANLCKRLEKRDQLPFTALPAKWRLYLVTAAGNLLPFFTYGYIRIRSTAQSDLFVAAAMGPPPLLSTPAEKDAFVRADRLNAYLDAVGQTGFGALANLCRQLHYHGFADPFDEIVLAPLPAALFLPAAIRLEQRGETSPPPGRPDD